MWQEAKLEGSGGRTDRPDEGMSREWSVKLGTVVKVSGQVTELRQQLIQANTER